MEKKITLTLNSASEKPTDIVWDLGGTAFKDYTQAVAAGTITPMAPADFSKDTISFYCYEGGERNVSVSYTVRGKSGSRKRTLDVLAPKLISYTSTTLPFSFTTGALDILKFGRRTPGGIAWRAKVQGPDIYDGTIKFTQLIPLTKLCELMLRCPTK